MAAQFSQANKGISTESASKIKVTILIFMVAKSPYFCHILLVRSKPQILPTLEGKGLPKGVNTRKWRLSVRFLLDSVCHKK